MNTFVNAVVNQSAYTTNGMKARKSSANAVVDLFYNAGASRGKDIVPAFTAAMAENRELALRVAAWLRDPRGGAVEGLNAEFGPTATRHGCDAGVIQPPAESTPSTACSNERASESSALASSAEKTTAAS